MTPRVIFQYVALVHLFGQKSNTTTKTGQNKYRAEYYRYAAFKKLAARALDRAFSLTIWKARQTAKPQICATPSGKVGVGA